MNSRIKLLSALLGALTACATGAAADEKTAYNQRAAETYVDLFKALDRDGNSTVTRVEASGDMNFLPRFDDMDINRDGAVTAVELQRYIELRFGVRIDPVGGK